MFKRRRWQFSLRTLLIVASATSVVSFAVHTLRTPTIVEIVDARNRLNKEKKYAQLIELIDSTSHLHPNSPIMNQLVEDAEYFRNGQASNPREVYQGDILLPTDLQRVRLPNR